ncbi:SprT family zinc-dependent metalloprotease [soil metagenome]
MSKNNSFQITVAGVPIKVTKKKVKHLRIVAYPSSGEVRISSPRHISDDEIRKFANARSDWIKKHLNNPRIKQREKDPGFENGSAHYIWGEPYVLKISEDADRFMIHVNGGNRIEMSVQRGSTLEDRKPIMREWYRRSIKRRIPALIKKWEPVMGVKVKDWGVKKMKTRWGTCNTRAKRIWLNLEIAKRDPKFLEYIVVHEMTHLLERPHSKKFYRLMDAFLPGWRTTDQQLGGKHWNRK